MSRGWLTGMGLFGLLMAGLGLRLWRLAVPLWYDEAFSAWLAGLPAARLIEAAAGDVHPPLYYLILRAVTLLLGSSETALRLPSVLAGLALVYAVYELGRALQADPKAVWLVAALTAFAPFQLYYSQEARPYALLALASVVCALGLIRGQWVMAVGGGLAALYLHNMAGLFVGALWLAAWVRSRETKRLFAAGIATAAGYVPGFIFSLQQARAVGAGYWVPPISSPGRVLATLDDLVWFTPSNPFVIATGLLTGLALTLLLADLVTDWRRRQLPFNTNVPTFLLIAAFLPLALVVAASLLWQPVLISRSVAPAAPFYYLLLAGVVVRSRRRLVTFGLLAVPTLALILAGPLLGDVGRPAGRPELRDMYGGFRPGDGIYHANVGSYVVWHYYRPDVAQYLWPQATTIHETLSTRTRRAMGMEEATFEELACRPDMPRRWWLIYAHNPTTLPAEVDYVEHLTRDYPAHSIALLRSDVTVEAWLYRLEPVCEERSLSNVN